MAKGGDRVGSTVAGIQLVTRRANASQAVSHAEKSDEGSG